MDASAMVDVLVGARTSQAIRDHTRGRVLHAPGHFDAEVLSAIGRLHRAGAISAKAATARLRSLAASPVQRHPLDSLVGEAWSRRHNLRLTDALYAALSERLNLPIITTDASFVSAAPGAILVEP
ncbi:MAG: type II toxin-antitoxin system VapC family toxin [Acidimicrobiia bacterium]